MKVVADELGRNKYTHMWQQMLMWNLLNNPDKVVRLYFPRRTGKDVLVADLTHLGVPVIVPFESSRKAMIDYNGADPNLVYVSDPNDNATLVLLHGTVVVTGANALEPEHIEGLINAANEHENRKVFLLDTI